MASVRNKKDNTGKKDEQEKTLESWLCSISFPRSLPTLPLSTSSASSGFCSIHPSIPPCLPFLGCVIQLFIVCAPPTSSHLSWGWRRTLLCSAWLLHGDRSFRGVCYSGFASRQVEGQQHTHAHADIVPHIRELSFIHQPCCKNLLNCGNVFH